MTRSADRRTAARGLSSLAWPDLGDAASCVLVVPVGSTEQHGPHLPFTVDAEIAAALAERAAAARPWMVVAPPVAYGSSGEHAGFPGTLSIGQQAVEMLLVELVRSADMFLGTLLVSGHGGNAEPVRRAAETLRHERRNVCVWSPDGDPADSHAGAVETSVMLALRPEAVRMERARRGDTRPLKVLLPELRAGGVRAVNEDGVLGDPTAASADEGRRILSRWTDGLLSAADAWYPRVLPAA